MEWGTPPSLPSNPMLHSHLLLTFFKTANRALLLSFAPRHPGGTAPTTWVWALMHTHSLRSLVCLLFLHGAGPIYSRSFGHHVQATTVSRLSPTIAAVHLDFCALCLGGNLSRAIPTFEFQTGMLHLLNPLLYLPRAIFILCTQT